MPNLNRRPWWLLVIIIIAALPVFAFPTLLSLMNEVNSEIKIITWFYLYYVIGTAYLAWICWPERKYMTWILLVLLLMSHVAIWCLALYNPTNQ